MKSANLFQFLLDGPRVGNQMGYRLKRVPTKVNLTIIKKPGSIFPLPSRIPLRYTVADVTASVIK